MSKLHYIAKSVNVLNGLLLLAVAAAAYETVVPYLDLKIRPTLPSAGKAVMAPPALPLSPPAPTLHDYAALSEQNLFHPQRRIPQEKIDEKALQAAAIPKPELTLYGTLIAEDLSIAYVEDKKAPFSTPGRGQRQRQLKKGDVVGGFVLKEIEADRIVLVKGEERLVVLLDQKDKKRSGEASATAAAPAAPAGLQPQSGAPGAPATGPAGLRQRYPSPAVPRPAAAPAALGAAPAANQAGNQGTPSPAAGQGATPDTSQPTVVSPPADQGSSAATLDELYPLRPGADASSTRPGARKRLYDIRPVPAFRH